MPRSSGAPLTRRPRCRCRQVYGGGSTRLKSLHLRFLVCYLASSAYLSAKDRPGDMTSNVPIILGPLYCLACRTAEMKEVTENEHLGPDSRHERSGHTRSLSFLPAVEGRG